MRAARIWAAFCLLLVAVLAGAAPQLVVPNGRLGQAGSAGPLAIYRGNDGLSFLIQASGEIAAGAGTLKRRALDIGSDGTIVYAAEPTWDAAVMLSAGTPRKIFTADASGTTVPFAWETLPPAARSLLDVPDFGAPADGMGELRTAFLRGERTLELGQPQGKFRKRTSPLGDIVNSVPLIVGPPLPDLADSGHAAFRAQFKGREPAVFVGANDGMLHAFSAATGAELFAYVPAVLMPHLPVLSSPAYQWRPFVDGSAGVGDARVGGTWRTILASGMGMGARGLFALDVSDPARFSAGLRCIWEFTEADDPGIGYLRSAPLVAAIRFRRGLSEARPGYFAIVTSGWNKLAQDGGDALFLLSLDKPASQKWQLGVNYFSIATAGGEGLLPNALSPPALVLSMDGSASRAYAGDLHGNLWRFDFGSMTAKRLFTARDDGGAPQPIAHAPKVVFAPGGGYLVLFATGKLIEEADWLAPSFTQQSVYAIFDAPPTDRESAVTHGQLAARTLSTGGTGYAISGGEFTYFGPDAKKGWYFNFPNTRTGGERAAGSPVSIEGAIAIASVAPGAAKNAAPATRLYLVDALSGFAYDPIVGAKRDAATGALVPIDALQPLIFIDSRSSLSERDPTRGATARRRLTLVTPGGGAQATPPVKIDVRSAAGRMSWREVTNWQELHQAATKK